MAEEDVIYRKGMSDAELRSVREKELRTPRESTIPGLAKYIGGAGILAGLVVADIISGKIGVSGPVAVILAAGGAAVGYLVFYGIGVAFELYVDLVDRQASGTKKRSPAKDRKS